jgi:predicted cupin superfamily sugar epimerase
MTSVEELIRLLDLHPHPEGGYYRETYRAPGRIPASGLPAAFGGSRSFSTAILFLLPAGSVSKLHRIRSDELWHFYEGAPLKVSELADRGARETLLGAGLLTGERLQHAVAAGTWFGAETTGEYSLVGCTVAPGFDFADFELGRREELLARFPMAAATVRRLT